MNEKKYLDELISLQNNGMIKVITGMRRCSKSYLLFEIFSSYLEQNRVDTDHLNKEYLLPPGMGRTEAIEKRIKDANVTRKVRAGQTKFLAFICTSDNEAESVWKVDDYFPIVKMPTSNTDGCGHSINLNVYNLAVLPRF